MKELQVRGIVPDVYYKTQIKRNTSEVTGYCNKVGIGSLPVFPSPLRSNEGPRCSGSTVMVPSVLPPTPQPPPGGMVSHNDPWLRESLTGAEIKAFMNPF